MLTKSYKIPLCILMDIYNIVIDTRDTHQILARGYFLAETRLRTGAENYSNFICDPITFN